MTEFLAPILAAGIGKALLYLTTAASAGGVIPFILELLKKFVPGLSGYHDTILKTTAVLAAVAASVGIGYSYDLGAGKLVIDGLTPLNLAYFLLAVAGQFGLQEWVFQRFIKGRLGL